MSYPVAYVLSIFLGQVNRGPLTRARIGAFDQSNGFETGGEMLES